MELSPPRFVAFSREFPPRWAAPLLKTLSLHFLAESSFLVWLLFVTVYDFRKRRVPNWLVLGGAALALAALAVDRQPFGLSWIAALLGAAIGFGFLLLFYVLGLMGAGDVKFAGALGLWVGLSGLVPIWIAASLMAGLHGVLWLALKRWAVFPKVAVVLRGRSQAPDGIASPGIRARFIPYAAYLAMATAAWIVWGRQS